jgi:secreted trypsin-like serine protease
MLKLTFICVIFISLSLSVFCANKFRVVGGVTTVEHEFPSIVAIRVYSFSFCGGTLIGPKTVLTAAHCLGDLQFLTSEEMKAQYSIIAGEHDKLTDTGKERVSKIIGFTMHPGYTFGANKHDIALLELETPIYTELHIEYASLASKDTKSQVGDICDVVGWGGITTNGGVQATILQKTDMKIVTQASCATRFRITSDMNVLCAVDPLNANKGGCMGDSGGPLYCRDAYGLKYQAGIVSFGPNPCAQRGVPNVYTSVHAYSDWILSNKFD